MPAIDNCRICKSSKLDLALDLGSQPWCNNFLRAEEVGKELHYPLRLVHCAECCAVQLDYTVKKEIMFGDHTYLSGITRSLDSHFKNVAIEVDEKYGTEPSKKSVLDIGSNDGTQLKHYKALGYDVLGVESSKRTATLANNSGIETINAFFNEDLARSLGRKFHIVNASGVFFHLEELHSFAEGIRNVLSDEGVFVVQFLYLKSIIENCAFDQIYHEHLLYYSLQTIEQLLRLHGLEMFDAILSPIHGGSIIGYVGHSGLRATTSRLERLQLAETRSGCNDFKTLLNFRVRIEEMKEKNLSYLNKAKSRRSKIYGMGAPAKGNTLLNYFGIGREYIDFLAEKNNLRRGLFSPGKHIPIIMEDEITEPPDIYYVLAWNFKQEILANNQQLIERGVEFFFPVN
ncbi:MAG TPA: class I SAM-dependent methyltransferase [Candidatus Melainabacteria bacterium]|nr:class I SAM-dependent methyltransferase [Candidatus Melainabacteria bacterium]